MAVCLMDEYINELGALTRNILDRLSIVSYEELESFVEDRQLPLIAYYWNKRKETQSKTIIASKLSP